MSREEFEAALSGAVAAVRRDSSSDVSGNLVTIVALHAAAIERAERAERARDRAVADVISKMVENAPSIVAELRAHHAEDPMAGSCPDCRLTWKAADAIDALRAEVAALKARLDAALSEVSEFRTVYADREDVSAERDEWKQRAEKAERARDRAVADTVDKMNAHARKVTDERDKAISELREIARVADTLSPQEIINHCANGIGVDRHEYPGNRRLAHRSVVDLDIELRSLTETFMRDAADWQDQTHDLRAERDAARAALEHCQEWNAILAKQADDAKAALVRTPSKSQEDK